MLSSAFILASAVIGGAPQADALVKLAELDKAPNSQIKWAMRKSGKWTLMKNNSQHLKEGFWDDTVSEVVSVVHRKGKYTRVTVTMGSSSGDWSQMNQFTFWPTGQLGHAKFWHQRIDYAGHSLTRWFTKTGAQEKRTDEYMNGDGAVTKDAAAVTRAKEFNLGGETWPKTLKSLPYAKLFRL
jgi:hypothetical protein